ncbi:glr1224 [Gloeobacter violaceus PCC 7421]|uniref:Glr1224 protein n=2 Tax=Gloeobacter violaceus TaxID=33072 RepID=Q7NLA2_GLOVI|nr:glr1224 [Gloeobacter violaceus PCC 7421]
MPRYNGIPSALKRSEPGIQSTQVISLWRTVRPPTMTTSNGQPPEFSFRLDRIEAIVAANSEQITANTTAITRLEANQAALSERVNIMAERVDTVSESVNQVSRIALAILQRVDSTQTEIRDLQTDMRGLQLENRRILDILQQRRGDG